jgi:hypothetical protein
MNHPVRLALLAAAMAGVLATPAHARGVKIPEGGSYTAPMGGFSCGPFRLTTRAEAAFDAHGGTVRLTDDSQTVRVDVVQFDPPLTQAAYEQGFVPLHEGFARDHELAAVRQGAQDAALDGAEFRDIGNHRVYRAAIALPHGGEYLAADGQRVDGVRGHIQYSDGTHMFVVSTVVPRPADLEPAKARRNAYAAAEDAVLGCTFPKEPPLSAALQAPGTPPSPPVPPAPPAQPTPSPPPVPPVPPVEENPEQPQQPAPPEEPLILQDNPAQQQ